MAAEQTKAVEIFYSYAPADEKLRNELEKHLKHLTRQHQITGWYANKIGAGKESAEEIDTHFNNARIILLLISPDFMASDYCYGVEVQQAMERHEAGEVRVIPILLRQVDWQGALFAKLQPLPAGGKAITSWSNRDEAFFDVAQGIRQAVNELIPTLVNVTDPQRQQSNDVQVQQSLWQTLVVEEKAQGLERPATAFLSYLREDAEEVKYLQQQLKVRGVRAWRDVTDLALGGSTKDEIMRAIEVETDAFVIYVTQQCLASDFIWNIEVPTALERQEHDRDFNVIPILRGVTFEELQQFCQARGYRSLTEFQCVRLPIRVTSETEAGM